MLNKSLKFLQNFKVNLLRRKKIRRKLLQVRSLRRIIKRLKTLSKERKRELQNKNEKKSDSNTTVVPSSKKNDGWITIAIGVVVLHL